MKKKKFRYLDHTADAKFRAYGNSEEEAFQNAAVALVNLMWNPDEIESREKKNIHVTGRDKKQLLVNFLEEILFLLESHDFLVHTVEDLSISQDEKGYGLRVSFSGDRASGGYEIFGSIKAVTYSDMMIKRNNGCVIQVVVDM